MTALSPLLQGFFTERLVGQRDASQHTVAAYRDAFRLLLAFVHERRGTAPSKLLLEDLDAATITAFLAHLEQTRHNSVRTRNARLTAIRSFFHYAALKAPEQAELIARVLSIPEKRFDTTEISYLTEAEITALLRAPDRTTWVGRRDHALLLVAVQTGLRVSELAGLCRQDLQFDGTAWVRCRGKGRKERCTPLSRPTRPVLQSWLRERGGAPSDPLFPNRSGHHLTRGAIWRLVAKHTATAGEHCPSLATKNITPHTLRHTAAMRLLHARTPVDIATIALWLGHETLETTNKYLHADMELKRRAQPHRSSQHQARPLSATRLVARVPREPVVGPKYVDARSPVTAKTKPFRTRRDIVPGATYGRKERATPLTGLTVAVLRGWLAEQAGEAHDPLFPTRTGTRLSHDAIERRLAGHLPTAHTSCPSLRGKHVTMHTLRHTAAMRLLHAGVDIAVIALWLGHEQIATTHIYLHADMNQKERAITRVTPPNTTPGRYRPPDPLLAFLDSL